MMVDVMSRHVPVAAQVGGAMVALAGLVLLAGVAWALLVGGIALTAVGALREAGVI